MLLLLHVFDVFLQIYIFTLLKPRTCTLRGLALACSHAHDNLTLCC